MKINIASKALEEAYSIYALYVSSDNAHADQFIINFYSTLDRLKIMPRLGKVFNSKETKSLRYIPILDFNSYYIFYYPLDDSVEVIRVLYSGMDLSNILMDDNNEARN